MDLRVAPTNHLFDVIVAIVLGVAVIATLAKSVPCTLTRPLNSSAQ